MPFNIGDVVQLKSGGPNMTITRLPDSGETQYSCTWWNLPLSKYDEHDFLEEALQRVPESLIG